LDWAYMVSHTAADVKLGCSAANAAEHVVPEFGSTKTVGVNTRGFAQKFVSCPVALPARAATAVIHRRRCIASGERLWGIVWFGCPRAEWNPCRDPGAMVSSRASQAKQGGPISNN
jgi:hypothetical protein